MARPRGGQARRSAPKWSRGKAPLSGGRGLKLLALKFMAVDMVRAAPDRDRAGDRDRDRDRAGPAPLWSAERIERAT